MPRREEDFITYSPQERSLLPCIPSEELAVAAISRAVWLAEKSHDFDNPWLGHLAVGILELCPDEWRMKLAEFDADAS